MGIVIWDWGDGFRFFFTVNNVYSNKILHERTFLLYLRLGQKKKKGQK